MDINTIIVFASNNGAHLEGSYNPKYWDSNGLFSGHKRDLYEGGIHASFIVCWLENVKVGTVSSHIGAF